MPIEDRGTNVKDAFATELWDIEPQQVDDGDSALRPNGQASSANGSARSANGISGNGTLFRAKRIITPKSRALNDTNGTAAKTNAIAIKTDGTAVETDLSVDHVAGTNGHTNGTSNGSNGNKSHSNGLASRLNGTSRTLLRAVPLDEVQTREESETLQEETSQETSSAESFADIAICVDDGEEARPDVLPVIDTEVELGPRPRRRVRSLSLFSKRSTRVAGSFVFSMLAHATALVALGLWLVPEVVTQVLPTLIVDTSVIEEELEVAELEESTDASTELNFSMSAAAADSAAAGAPQLTDPTLDQEVVAQDPSLPSVSLGGMLDMGPGREQMLTEAPEGTLGTARAVVDNYEQAIDRITQEIMWNLATSKVLVVWCFDQSGSMKDDQDEIRARIERVYKELGLSGVTSSDALTTAVTSYGRGFSVGTELPTSNLEEIQAAIDAVPVDPSGKEMMCQAVGRSIAYFRTYANRTQRRMVLVLVTDESGDRRDNVQYLEAAIAEAKAARCKVYVLGREAVFGYPYGYIHWRHPQTQRPHWLRIDRGPETAFVEQVQTNGFEHRHDAFPSGYGPYAQSRLAQQTSGIFFLLPSVESNLVRGQKRRYELEAMRGYTPDLRARVEIFLDRDNSPLQMLIWGIINDLSPHNTEATKVTQLRVHFSPYVDEFAKQVPKELMKIGPYTTYLSQAIDALEKHQQLRYEENSLRWQANYDLLLAQLMAYKVRAIEYTACLQDFVKNPQVIPAFKSPDRYFVCWDITTQRDTRTGDLVKADIERANALFAQVIKEHPGTPWAARARWELRRGYGVQLHPFYDVKYKDVEKPDPVPKL